MMPENEGAAIQAEDASHDMDLVPFFSETGPMAEMESVQIQSILEANGIPFTVFGNSSLPVTEFSVNVPKNRLAEAQRVIADAQAAGPAAADEAERQSEIAGATPEQF